MKKYNRFTFVVVVVVYAALCGLLSLDRSLSATVRGLQIHSCFIYWLIPPFPALVLVIKMLTEED